MEAQLLLLGQADAVLGVPPAAVAVHPRQRQFLGGVFRNVGDRRPDPARELHLRTRIPAHDKNLFYARRRCAGTARLRTGDAPREIRRYAALINETPRDKTARRTLRGGPHATWIPPRDD